MIRCAVDTNVPIVANGRPDPEDPRPPTVACRIACVEFLLTLVRDGLVLLDTAGDIQEEYRRHLKPKGQPGVGDRFYQVVLQSAPHLVERCDLPRRPDGEYVDLAQSLIDIAFDPSDRKFAAMAKREAVPVYNATDSDWVNAAHILAAEAIDIQHLCGCDNTKWFKT